MNVCFSIQLSDGKLISVFYKTDNSNWSVRQTWLTQKDPKDKELFGDIQVFSCWPHIGVNKFTKIEVL